MNISREDQFKTWKRKKLRWNIISDILLIVGGITYARANSGLLLMAVGDAILLAGMFFFIKAVKFRNKKEYRELEKEFEDDISLKQMINMAGMGTVILGFILSLLLLFSGIFFLFFLAQFDWLKGCLFFVAFELVTTLRSYFKLVSE